MKKGTDWLIDSDIYLVLKNSLHVTINKYSKYCLLLLTGTIASGKYFSKL